MPTTTTLSIETPAALSAWIAPIAISSLLAKTASIGRPATTAEVAETVRWLALEAPPSATGAVIDVNGASFVR